MRYYIATFGCQTNEADSERIEARLQAMGHKKASQKAADLVIINACSVRQSAMDRVYAKIKQSKGKKIVLAGCLLEADKKKLKDKVNEIWHPNEYFNLRPIYSDPDTAFVPIMTGCDNFCTYCAVPYTRGPECSRSVKEIVKEVRNLTRKDYKEIWLLGQNVNSYRSGKIDFPKLLRTINNIPGRFCVRFMSPHPKDVSDELIEIIANSEKIVKEIHLPVQSGDDEILKKMNRNYTSKQYINLVKKIREKIPDIKISTDAIVGFPGETKKQFQNTVKLFKEVGFDKAYVAKYSPRPGTTAFKFKNNVSFKEKKRRWQILNETIRPSDGRIIVVLGPTASGKSDLAVEIAKKFNGEVISADSRQVYKGMNIGTGKITKKEMKGIKHYLLDIISPKKIFTAIDFKNMAEKAIDEILKKGKTPIICGGTGFYIHALLGEIKIPKIAPDWKLRKKLEKKSAEELFKMLEKLDVKRAKNVDSKNKRRLIRAIEVELSRSDLNSSSSQLWRSDLHNFEVLWLGIKLPQEELKKRVNKRVDKMIRAGLEKEVRRLVSAKGGSASGGKKYGWTKILKNTIGYQEFLDKNPAEKIKLHTLQYAKRQMTWFKKYPSTTLRASAPKVHWVTPRRGSGQAKKEAFGIIKKFLN